MATTIVDFVRNFNKTEGRGCPAGAIEYVGGFSKKEIDAAKKKGVIVSNRGTHGGFFPKDEIIVTKKVVQKDSLKADMVAFITAIANDTEMDSDMRESANDLVARYNAECAKKKASAATRKSKTKSE